DREDRDPRGPDLARWHTGAGALAPAVARLRHEVRLTPTVELTLHPAALRLGSTRLIAPVLLEERASRGDAQEMPRRCHDVQDEIRLAGRSSQGRRRGHRR